MYKSVTEVQKKQSMILKAISHPVRLYIVDTLSKRKVCVCSLAEELGISFAAVSKHFSVLKNAGIVYEERDGNNIYYRLKSPCIVKLLKSVSEIYKCINK